MARVLEALQANDWTAAGGDGVEDILGDSDDDKDGEASSASGEIRESTAGNRHTRDMDLDPAALDFGFDREDFAGLQQAIWQASQEREDQEEGDSGEQDEGAGKKTRTKKGGSLSGDDDEELNEESVQRVETLMRRLMAAREAAQGLPEDQRRRLAARAVGEVMRDL